MHPLIIEANEKVDGRNIKMFDVQIFANLFDIIYFYTVCITIQYYNEMNIEMQYNVLNTCT